MLRQVAVVAVLAATLAAQTPRYSDPQGRFSLQPPAGWTSQQSPDGNVVFTDASGRVSLGVAPTVFDGPATLAEASAAFAQLLQSRPGLTVEPAGDEDLQLAGVAARRSSYRLQAGGSAIRLEATFVLVPNLLLTLSASAPGDVFAQHQDSVQKAIASLQLAGALRPAATPRTEIESKLAALAAARDAGILGDQEYAAKKAELEAQLRQPQEPDAELARKLQALEAARDAGVISDAEYTAKKAALAQSGQDDAAKAGKLEALAKAHAAGVISDAEFAAKKAALLGSAANPVAAPAQLPPRPAQKGTTYQHPIGFTMWHPEGWKVEAQEDFLQLTPPDPSGGKDAPNEVYLLIGDSIEGEGIQTPDDPAVATYLDAQVHSIAQVLQRQGQPTAVPMARGKGARYEWRGRIEGQPEVAARGFACIINGYGIALLGIGFPKDLDKREATLRQIFASFGFGEGKKDPALVGSWSLISTATLDNNSPYETSWSRARMVKDTTSTLSFRADGSWQRIDSYHMIAMGAGVSLEDKGQKQSQGTWNAADGGLFMIWQDKTWEDYRYELRQTAKGPELRLVSGNTGQVWQRN